MVLIIPSSKKKIAGIIGTAMLLIIPALILIAVAINANHAENEIVGQPDESITQSHESETQDECTEMTESTTPNSTTASETEEATEGTEAVEETTAAVDEATTDTDEEQAEDLYIQYYTEQDAIDIAKVLYHECRGVPSKTEQACVAWTILNRVDGYGSTVYSVVRSPNQFAFYESAPVWDELLDLAHDVLNRWSREKTGEIDVGRVLPQEYIYFEGRNGHNYFRDNYDGTYHIWDYSLVSPYES